MIATAIATVLSNFFIVLFVVAICTTVAKLRRFARERRPADAEYVLWGELLFYNVGIGLLYAGLLHAYAQGLVAPTIGWQPSPFEYELGWASIGIAVVALVALWRGYEFRLAATLAFAVFSLAAAAQHIQEIACCKNYAPGNAGLILWFGDIFVPILLLVVAALARPASRR